ncbi:hypothetical protein LVD15_11255 [Fulvivirga maritima]|uniref:hypothetical protein n=1 Tax=Fulvivirga maritima TaxID=2904247 RepID=UPI001F2D380B|nr:hypothetical protein [Fulvivirga maritima]UII28974.1 hypothetical protein LVD15_11255 [Fulvivirga maritima]
MSYFKMLLIGLSIVSCTSKNHDTKLKTSGVSHKEESSQDVKTLSFSQFLEAIPEKQLPVQENEYLNYLTEYQLNELNTAFKLNKRNLNGFYVYYTKDYDIQSILSANREKLVGKSLEEQNIDPLQNELFRQIIIPVIKVKIKEIYLIGFLTYTQSEFDDYLACIELNIYNSSEKKNIEQSNEFNIYWWRRTWYCIYKIFH